MSHPAGVVTVNCSSFLSLEAPAAICTPTWCCLFLRLVPIPEECEVPAGGGAVELGFSGYRVTDGLIQQLPAAIALFGDVQALRANVGEFGGGEFHAAPPLDSSSSGRISGEGWLRGGCGFCRTFPRFTDVSC